MLIPFIAVLAALGAAFVFQGREVRGLLVLLVANVVVGLCAAASTRWGWLAFSSAMTAMVLIGLAAAVADPAPDPEPEERDPDYCFTHKKIEPKEER